MIIYGLVLPAQQLIDRYNDQSELSWPSHLLSHIIIALLRSMSRRYFSAEGEPSPLACRAWSAPTLLIAGTNSEGFPRPSVICTAERRIGVDPLTCSALKGILSTSRRRELSCCEAPSSRVERCFAIPRANGFKLIHWFEIKSNLYLIFINE